MHKKPNATLAESPHLRQLCEVLWQALQLVVAQGENPWLRVNGGPHVAAKTLQDLQVSETLWQAPQLVVVQVEKPLSNPEHERSNGFRGAELSTPSSPPLHSQAVTGRTFEDPVIPNLCQPFGRTWELVACLSFCMRTRVHDMFGITLTPNRRCHPHSRLSLDVLQHFPRHSRLCSSPKVSGKRSSVLFFKYKYLRHFEGNGLYCQDAVSVAACPETPAAMPARSR